MTSQMAPIVLLALLDGDWWKRVAIDSRGERWKESRGLLSRENGRGVWACVCLCARDQTTRTLYGRATASRGTLMPAGLPQCHPGLVWCLVTVRQTVCPL